MLITTACNLDIEKTLGHVYLGEWCFRYPEEFDRSKIEVLPYHWDDRRKLYRDFCYLQVLNTEIISELSDQLNIYHKVEHSRKYWELLLGYWVNLYTAVLFDRWSMVKVAEESGLVDEVAVVEYREGDLVSDNLSEFNALIHDDDWNLKLYSLLFEYSGTIPCNRVNQDSDRRLNNRVPRAYSKVMKGMVKSVLRSLSGLIGRKDEFFVIASYMNRKTEKRLIHRLVGGARHWDVPDLRISGDHLSQRRTKLTSVNAGGDEFFLLAKRFLSDVLPKVFIEGYREMREYSKRMGWPNNPKVIFTSNRHFTSEIFNHWAGEKRECGARLIIGEHGGFGVGKFNGAGTFQLNCSDRFLSSGWGGENEKIFPVGNFRIAEKKQKWDRDGGLLLVTVAMPRYSFDVRSMVISGQMLDYFNDQYEFVQHLPNRVFDQLLVRLYHVDYGWGQKQRWRSRFPAVQFDTNCKISKSIGACRIFVSTYCATTYIDSLAQNIPTVIYWNRDHWENTNEAEPYFQELAKVGIFHESPISAAQHVTAIWGDVEQWWEREDVQYARLLFCDKYSNSQSDLVDSMESVFRSEYQISIKNAG